MRKVWTPKGQKPIAHVNPRYQWLYLYAFVHPQTEQTVWYILPYVNAEMLNLVLADLAAMLVTDKDDLILLVLDGAGWHKAKALNVPNGIQLDFLPPYSPELQPAERLWELTDQPLVNTYFDTLDDMTNSLNERCRFLLSQPDTIASKTCFHWWPQT